MRFTDLFYELIRVNVFIGRLMGVLHFVKKADGIYLTKICSPSFLYLLCLYPILTYVWFLALSEILEKLKDKTIEGRYSLFIMTFFHPLPLILVCESKKINEFLTSWMRYQITGKRLRFDDKTFKIFIGTVKICYFALPPVLIARHFPGISTATRCLIWYYLIFKSFLITLWFELIYSLRESAVRIQQLATSVVRGKTSRMTISDVEILWVGLYRLTKMTGRTFCLTYGLYILLDFVQLTVTIYECLTAFSLPITEKSLLMIISSSFAIIQTASIPVTSHWAMEMIGEDFYKLLIDLKIKESAPKYAAEIESLLQAISDNQPMIDLGGFVTLDNALITSLMNTMVTYLIVLLQFKV